MSTKIKILSHDQAQKIAAGEVVERPATIIKETIENSIDAGATVITVWVEQAGKKLLKIRDNGCGMSVDDAKLCFARHATSKLSAVEELTTIRSFGFRGEALASIGAVARVTLTTREQNSDDPLGTHITFYDSQYQDISTTSCQPGTTLEISDLFYNVPARKKFLKQDQTEYNQINQVITSFALTNPTLNFTLYKDGKQAVTYPPVQTLHERIAQVWGHNTGQQMIPLQISPTLQQKNNGITLSGMISAPTLWRYGKHALYFFVNNRLVKNSDLSKALVKGYRDVLPPGRFPAVCLMITVNGTEVDVNIHPRKEEVRFTHPGRITSLISAAVTYTLEQHISQQLSPPTRAPFTIASPVSAPHNNNVLKPFAAPPQFTRPLTQPLKQPPIQPLTNFPVNTSPPAPEQQAAVPTTQEAPRIIGQLADTYILIQNNDGLIIIDQHAAHERILYHQFTHVFTKKDGTALLFPHTVTIPTEQVALLLKHKEFFDHQGITLEQAGPCDIAITSAPPKLQKEQLSEIIQETAHLISQHTTLNTEDMRKKLNEHVHSHMCCKMAVRAGDTLTHAEMSNIVAQLLVTPNRFICIHGRPTMWPITLHELEKKFRRR